jgi:hypothetical protein
MPVNLFVLLTITPWITSLRLQLSVLTKLDEMVCASTRQRSQVVPFPGARRRPQLRVVKTNG